MARPKEISRQTILDSAQVLLKACGFNGFSTRELADEVGISSASLHHHFPTKADLAAGVAARLRERLNQHLSTIAAELEGLDLRVGQIGTVLGGDTELLSMLAADFPTLPAKAQDEVRQLFANLRGWLTRFAVQAKADGDLNPEAVPEEISADIFSRLLGRALLSRTDKTMALPVPTSVWAWQR